MKQLSKFLLASLFILSFSMTHAQTENNPWALGININAVDFFPVGEPAPQGHFLENPFNTDHWNITGASVKGSLARYIGKGFSVKIDASYNKIDKIGDKKVSDFSFFSGNASIDYSIGHLIYGGEQMGWFDPFIGLGAGLTRFHGENAFTGNGEIGINFWLTDNISFTVGTVLRKSFDEQKSNYSHFQHFAGIKFAFGGRDSDGDGVYDKNDECPDVAGLPEFNGCPDTDGDGIPDKNDNCPDVAGLAQFNGCPDTDGDGIPDNKDECPTEAGSKALNGCPDADGDGVADKDDECPNEAGPEENNGCPWADTDGDGVYDKDDQCPDVAGTEANNGCPEITEDKIAELNEYSDKILFDFDSANIRVASHDDLAAIADVMKKYPNADFHLAGFTDALGPAAYNMKLSKERAASVRNYLVNKEGIDSGRLTSEGYGEQNPIAPNNTKAGRQKNRRVQIMLKEDRSDLESKLK